MFILNDNVNPNYTLIKSLQEAEDYNGLSQSTKLDENQYGYIYPPVAQGLTRYILEHNGRLRKCTSVLAQDTTLQDFVFKDHNGDIVEGELCTMFWTKKNKYNFYLSVMERFQYGFGCCEILLNNDNTPCELNQIPAQTMVIQKENDTYYAVQMEMGAPIKKFRLYNLLDTYTDDDLDLNIVLWLGGGADYRFYDVPVWYPDIDAILGKINLDMLTAKQLNNGNNISGVLNITGPPQKPDPITGKTVKQELQEQMQKVGSGVMVSYLATPDRDFPLKFEFIKVSNDNWDYLKNFSKDADDAIMAEYSIPKVRLLIDDVTESMNSNKSYTLWKIYTASLQNEQLSNELIIQDFNRIFFDVDYELDISTPMFTDEKQEALKSVLLLYDTGLLTLGEAITKVSEAYPELKIDVNPDDLVYNERYYKGKALGFTDFDGEPEPVEDLDAILELFK